MNSLETRKQLLISESEVNRVLLLREYGELAGGVRDLTHKARRWALIASSLLMVARGLSNVGKRRDAGEKRTMTQTVLAGLRGAASLLFNIWSKRQ